MIEIINSTTQFYLAAKKNKPLKRHAKFVADDILFRENKS